MPLKQKPLRVVLAQPVGDKLSVMIDAISAESDIVLSVIKDTPDNLWRAIIKHSPDITIFYAPVFGNAEKRCVNHILHGVYSKILLLVEDIGNPQIPNDPKIEKYPIHNKPESKTYTDELIKKIKSIGPVTRKPTQKPLAAGGLMNRIPDADERLQKHVIAIGASTGGTEAMAKLFHQLPEKLPGVVVVQHMPPVFTKMYAERLNRELALTVKEAVDNEMIKPGTVYIAPGDRHLQIKRKGPFYYTVLGNTEKVSGHCPSVDVLFNSVAKEAGKDATGIILTGMGADGALGLLRMKNMGAYTIGQDEKSSVVYGMPKKALEYGAVIKQSGLEDIANHLINHLTRLKIFEPLDSI